jgi:hypothetical protein
MFVERLADYSALFACMYGDTYRYMSQLTNKVPILLRNPAQPWADTWCASTRTSCTSLRVSTRARSRSRSRSRRPDRPR